MIGAKSIVTKEMREPLDDVISEVETEQRYSKGTPGGFGGKGGREGVIIRFLTSGEEGLKEHVNSTL